MPPLCVLAPLIPPMDVGMVDRGGMTPPLQ